MKSSFSYDGNKLVIRLDVQDKTERAVARLLDKLCQAQVGIIRPMYANYDSDGIDAIEITLRAPDGN